MSRTKLLQIDKNHIWHPFTQMKDYENKFHILIQSGKGLILEDADGKEYYDTVSSWWTSLYGHCRPELIRAMAEQARKLDHVIFAGFTHEPAIRLTESLLEILPSSLRRVFFSDNGSTAVEVALKMAFQYFQNMGKSSRQKFVMLEGAYHGDTIGSVSVGGIDLYHRLYKPLMFESFQVSGLNCTVCPYRQSEFVRDARNTGCSIQCFSQMKKVLRQHHEEICAVIVEPLLQGAAGMRVYPPEYLQKLRALTLELDILLIFDEVATGFGRTGTLFAMEQAGVVPDILCLSKSITGGVMPLAVTVTTEKIFVAFYDDYERMKTFFHGHSYTANPIACHVAATNLAIIKREKLPFSRCEEMDYFHRKMNAFEGIGFVSDIRYLGFIGAIDLKSGPGTNQKRIGLQVYELGLKEGLILRPLGNTIYWFLPVTIKKSEIKTILSKSIKIIQSVMKDVHEISR